MKNKIYSVKYLGHDGVTGEHKVYAMSEKEARMILHSMFPNARIYYCEQLGAIEITASALTATKSKGEIKMEQAHIALLDIFKSIEDRDNAIGIMEKLGGVVDIGVHNFVQFFDDEKEGSDKAKKMCRHLVTFTNEEKAGGFVYLTFELRN